MLVIGCLPADYYQHLGFWILDLVTFKCFDEAVKLSTINIIGNLSTAQKSAIIFVLGFNNETHIYIRDDVFPAKHLRSIVMPVVISVGSGKGGVGKSVISTNLAYLLARSGLSVTLVDMDSGGADLHILMGLFQPKYTLSDFIDRRVDSLNNVAQRLDGFKGIQLVTGTGDSLHNANMPAATRSKILRHIRLLETDIVLIDVGAGTHFNTLDFFNAADINLGVTTGDPTAILDLYRFIKLAVIRKALSSFLSYDKISSVVRKRNISDINELLSIAEEYGNDKKEAIEKSIDSFCPSIIFNQVDQNPNARFSRIQSLLASYLGVSKLALLGRIPEDVALRSSVKAYHPVASLTPTSRSARALELICNNLLKQINRII
ncbi:MAG: flagellar biosynthesis protein FlhG [Candidatus Azotimanducaceae bacterium]|jgi:flagellar biosynthesis protein FlhG